MLLTAIISVFLICGATSNTAVTDTTPATAPATTPAPAPPGTCPDGWIEAIEGCFLFHHTG